MTFDQGLVFAIIVAMMGLFVWGRLRYDLVAVLALLACVAVGIVPPDKAFTGFSDDIVIIVASALVVSAAVARSGIIETALRCARALSDRPSAAGRACWSASVTLLSAFVKNIGALAMMMPVAFQLARRTGTSPSALLMPMAFGVAARRHRHAGRHLAEHHRVAGARGDRSASHSICSTSRRSAPGSRSPASSFSCFGWRLLPQGSQGRGLHGCGLQSRRLHHGSHRAASSSAAGMTVKALRRLGENEIEVIADRRGDATARLRRRPAMRDRPTTFLSCKASRRRSTASWRWRSWSSARGQEPRDRYADRRDRRDGGGRHAGLRRSSATPPASSSCSTATRQPARGQPQRRRIAHRLRSVSLRQAT